MCENALGHQDHARVRAKVVIVGRSYATAPSEDVEATDGEGET